MTIPEFIAVEVTQDDIFKGHKDCLTCPIARALKRHFKDLGVKVQCQVYANGVFVSTEDFDGNGWSVDYDTSTAAHDFVIDFDEDRPVTPGVYFFSRPI